MKKLYTLSIAFFLLGLANLAGQVPILISPSNTTDLENSFGLNFSVVSGASNYTIEISKNGLYNDIAPDYQIQNSGSRYMWVQGLTYGSVYHVRATSDASAGQYWEGIISTKSDAYSYCTISNGTYIQNNNFYLYPYYQDCDQYDWEFDTDPSFSSSSVFRKTTTNAVDKGGFMLDISSLEYGTTYYVRVKAVKNGGGKWSEGTDIKNFTTAVAAPKLHYPADGQILDRTNTMLWIVPAKGADYFEIQVATDRYFTSYQSYTPNRKVYAQGKWSSAGPSDYVVSEVYYQLEDLSYNTNYFYRARSIKAGVPSEWSDVNLFFIQGPSFVINSPTVGSTQATSFNVELSALKKCR